MLAACGNGDRAAKHETVIGHKSAEGSHAVAIAYGETAQASGFSARVMASPDQRVTGFWSVVCHVQSPVYSPREGGDFARRTPFTVALRLPDLAPTDRYTCNVAGRAKLVGRGRVTVQLFAR